MYQHQQVSSQKSKGKLVLLVLVVVLSFTFFIVVGWLLWPFLTQPSTIQLLDEHLKISEEVDSDIASNIRTYAIENDIRIEEDLFVTSELSLDKPDDSKLTEVLVPVAGQYSTFRTIDNGLQNLLTSEPQIEGYELKDVYELTPEDTLLSAEGEYYLDTFTSGAIFNELVFEGPQAQEFDAFATGYQSLSSDNVLSMHTTGVTALTREMMNDLYAGVEPTFFSDQIGEFLSSADITHVSNEVSFKDGCTYSATLFCSPPEFIETLKASGVDVVELTGNHNNDVGSEYNTSTIDTYSELGWAHVGGGLNNEDAAKPYIVEQDGTTFGMLAYNYPDAPNGGAISGPDKAGANAYTAEKMKADVASLKEQVDFVQVNIQFWECYAYPDGYIEFPECDVPIGEQEPVFKSVVDAGADMVVGSSAHQPQTYEQYNDGWIYYGLGNLYFDQDRWPGTERGLILTNYYHDGKLLQTKITPTVYGSDFQTRKMTNQESQFLLQRLNDAR